MIKQASINEIISADKRKNYNQIARDILEFMAKNMECAEVDVAGRNAQGVSCQYLREIRTKNLQEKIRVARRGERVFLVKKEETNA